ncbi:MAG: hypothetical protein PHS01_11445 [Dysgonamonadaceae bacterium]|nr:hypothetical protein [Dysgonamonadaceae bacterium]
MGSILRTLRKILPIYFYYFYLEYVLQTLRSYCHHLKLYFDFLEQKKLDYLDVNIDNMADNPCLVCSSFCTVPEFLPQFEMEMMVFIPVMQELDISLYVY